jgi:hypothetical protein
LISHVHYFPLSLSLSLFLSLFLFSSSPYLDLSPLPLSFLIYFFVYLFLYLIVFCFIFSVSLFLDTLLMNIVDVEQCLRPPLWSSGQSFWLQIQRSWFDSRRFQIFWEASGLEQGPLSLVRTTEELLGRKNSGSGLENRG